MASTKAKMLQGYYDEVVQKKKTGTNSPVIKPAGAPIPQKGDAVDRVTSYMEADAAIRSTPVSASPRVSQQTSAPVAGIIPTTSNSVSSPVQQAPAPKAATGGQSSIQDMIQQMVDAKKTEEVPHYHPDLTPMNEDEMAEPIV